MHYTRTLNEQYQTAKAELGSTAQETIGNVRTVKAFADEAGSIKNFQALSLKVQALGFKKSIVWGCFMCGMKVFQSSAFAAMLFVVGQNFISEGLTIGTTMAYLLYMQKIVSVFSELAGHLITVSKVEGASYKVAELIITKSSMEVKEGGIKAESQEGQIKI